MSAVALPLESLLGSLAVFKEAAFRLQGRAGEGRTRERTGRGEGSGGKESKENGGAENG